MPIAPPGPEALGFDLEADSDDLTDDEVEGALPSEGPDDLLAHLSSRVCGADGCALHPTPLAYALRRRKPHLYTRIAVVCPATHRTDLVIRTTWVGPS